MSGDRPGRLPAPLVRGVNLEVGGPLGPRVDGVLRALARLRRMNAGPLSDGLSPAGAQRALAAAVDQITADGLQRALAAATWRPDRAAVIVARGVFTSPIEWAAALAVQGAQVLLKAPAQAPALCEALAACMQRHGLPVHSTCERDLRRALGGPPDRVVAFGADETVAQIAQDWPASAVQQHGHRFSLELLAGAPQPADADAVALDAALYDGRGCMAPALVLVVADDEAAASQRADAWTDALGAAMARAQAALPRGAVDPALGPEWRRRAGLARARGRLVEGDDWMVCRLPLAAATPAALPRMLTVHPVTPSALAALLESWGPQLSAIAADRDASLQHAAAASAAPRLCRPGTLQLPPFPRLHDGLPMLP